MNQRWKSHYESWVMGKLSHIQATVKIWCGCLSLLCFAKQTYTGGSHDVFLPIIMKFGQKEKKKLGTVVLMFISCRSFSPPLPLPLFHCVPTPPSSFSSWPGDTSTISPELLIQMFSHDFPMSCPQHSMF